MRYLGTVHFSVSMDDKGNLEIHRRQDLDATLQAALAYMASNELQNYTAVVENAGTLVGKALRYVANPDSKARLIKGI